MGNISNFNVNKVDMRLSNVDYWDLYLADGDFSVVPATTIFSGACLVVHYDFNEEAIFGNDGPYDIQYDLPYGDVNEDLIYSLTTWSGATNNGFTGSTFGLTSLDNGFTSFVKPSGDTSNVALTSVLTGTTLTIATGDTRLCLTRVSGSTGNYVYPLEVKLNSGFSSGQYVELCGGFYQGYYKLDSYDYEVLPTRVPKAWTAEAWL